MHKAYMDEIIPDDRLNNSGNLKKSKETDFANFGEGHPLFAKDDEIKYNLLRRIQ